MIFHEKWAGFYIFAMFSLGQVNRKEERNG